jgi:hypothetical protein
MIREAADLKAAYVPHGFLGLNAALCEQYAFHRRPALRAGRAAIGLCRGGESVPIDVGGTSR